MIRRQRRQELFQQFNKSYLNNSLLKYNSLRTFDIKEKKTPGLLDMKPDELRDLIEASRSRMKFFTKKNENNTMNEKRIEKKRISSHEFLNAVYEKKITKINKFLKK